MGLMEKIAEVRESIGNSAGARGSKLGIGNGSSNTPSKFKQQGVGNTPMPGKAPGAGYLAPWGEDRMTNLAITIRIGQVLMAFVMLIIAIVLASFQSKWIKGPSGLTILLLIVTIPTFLLTLLMLGLSYLPESMQDKGERIAALFSQGRLGLVMNIAGTAFWLLLALIQIISAFSSPGCKDPSKDPHAEKSTGKKDDYTKALPSFCTSKKAGAFASWILFGFCVAMLLLFLHSWRLSRKNGPRIPPFVQPDDDAFEPLGDDFDGDAENLYEQDKPTHAAPEASMVPPAARYGEGGDGRYSDPRYNEYRYAGTYDPDPRTAQGYIHQQQPNPFGDHAVASAPGGNGARQSYDQGAYGGAARAVPYADIQQQLRSGRPMPPNYRG